MIKFQKNEEWKDLPFDKKVLRNNYAISNHGRVASYRDKIREGKILRGGQLGGYPTLNIRPGGHSQTYYVHKLVADAFLPKPKKTDRYVIHLDYNKENNHATNLKWATKEQMIAHQQNNPFVIEGRKKRRNRKPQKGHKLTATQVRFIKKKIFDPNRKTRMKMIAKQFGISEMQLYRIKNGENWAHVRVENEPVRAKK